MGNRSLEIWEKAVQCRGFYRFPGTYSVIRGQVDFMQTGAVVLICRMGNTLYPGPRGSSMVGCWKSGLQPARQGVFTSLTPLCSSSGLAGRREGSLHPPWVVGVCPVVGKMRDVHTS